MALFNSRAAKAAGCPICGSPDRACGGLHAGDEPVPVDAPQVRPHGPATILARAKVNGIETIFKTTPEEAAAAGWIPLGAEPEAEPEPLTPAEVQHEARPPVSARNTQRAAPKNEKRSLDEVPMRALRRQGRQLNIAGAGQLSRAALIEAIKARLKELAV